MGTPQDDAALLAALNKQGQGGGTPTPEQVAAEATRVAAEAAAKTAKDAADAAAALAASQTPEAIAAKAAAEAAALEASKVDTQAEILKLQLAATEAQKASIAKPDDPALKAAADAALKAVNDLVSKAPAPAQTDEKKKDEQKADEIKLKVPEDKSLTEAEVQRLETFAKTHKFSQPQADALLAEAKQRELDGRAQAVKIQQGYLDAIQKDAELGGSTERVNMTLEKARLAAKHLFTQDDLLAMTKDGSANSPALVRACFRHYQTALASPALVGGLPVKAPATKGDARNPEDLAAAFAADRAASKK